VILDDWLEYKMNVEQTAESWPPMATLPQRGRSYATKKSVAGGRTPVLSLSFPGGSLTLDRQPPQSGNLRLADLFVAECFDRTHVGGSPRRIESEDESDAE
jgi:hypothetical protein